jgi:phosphatidylserine decarboxylase
MRGKSEIILLTEGWPFLLGALSLTVAAAWFGTVPLAVLFGLVFLFLVQFFRNPRRIPPKGAHLVLSPADGTVIIAKPTPDGGAHIAIFMSVVSVHVNRAPLSGKLLSLTHRGGKFLKANLPEAGDANEQNIFTFQTRAGVVSLKQIAGAVARRTVSWIREGDEVSAGDAIGMIKFSSRAELLLPPGATIIAAVGEKVYGGETVLATYEALKEEGTEA